MAQGWQLPSRCQWTSTERASSNCRIKIAIALWFLAHSTAVSSEATKGSSLPGTARILSIDALRGFVMFIMIFVNDLAGAPHKLVPDWMVHWSDRHHKGESGMTFVDLVFPGFLFIVG